MTRAMSGWLDEALPTEEFGGKAAALSRARRAGLPVPDGFALSMGSVERISLGHESGGGAVLRSLLDRLGGGPLAVRSSALGEDGADASFAGQHASVLGVLRSEGVVRAVREVWASARTPAALAYRRRLGIGGEPLAAAIVQRLVPADTAGVLFTRDPLSGRADQFVVEASRGLGESVVAGLVTPDSFLLARNGSVLSSRPGLKSVLVRLDPAGGTTRIPVTDERLVQEPCLDAAALHLLAELGGACEALFGAGQDVEWAFAAGSLSLLQCRPISGTVAKGHS
ncbi:MAG: PEP/pyruvate-binding domain-containing protein [Candidatus Dormibacteraceae bacterium]